MTDRKPAASPGRPVLGALAAHPSALLAAASADYEHRIAVLAALLAARTGRPADPVGLEARFRRFHQARPEPWRELWPTFADAEWAALEGGA